MTYRQSRQEAGQPPGGGPPNHENRPDQVDNLLSRMVRVDAKVCRMAGHPHRVRGFKTVI